MYHTKQPHHADSIEWNVTGDGASVSLVDGSSRLPIFETTGKDICGDAVRVEMTTIDSLVHLRVSRRGVCLLAACSRESGSRPVLYACTSVLAELGVGGGRYEVSHGRVVSE